MPNITYNSCYYLFILQPKKFSHLTPSVLFRRVVSLRRRANPAYDFRPNCTLLSSIAFMNCTTRSPITITCKIKFRCNVCSHWFKRCALWQYKAQKNDTLARYKECALWKYRNIFEENDLFFITKQIKKPCCVVNHLETLAYRLVFPPTLILCSSRFLRALQRTEQSTVKAYLFVK